MDHKRIRADFLNLAKFFNNAEISYIEACNLPVGCKITKNAAFAAYKKDTYEYCRNVKRVLSKNSGNISLLITVNDNNSNFLNTELSFEENCHNRLQVNENEHCLTDDEVDVANEIKDAFNKSFKATNIANRPTNAKNMITSQNMPSKSKDQLCFICPVLEGCFSISVSEWNTLLISDNKTKKIRFTPGTYVYFLQQKIKQVNNTCIFYVNSYRMNINSVIIYGYCGHVNCKTFKIKCCPGTDDILCHVYSSSLNFNHPYPYTRQVRGTERILLGQKFKGQNPVQMRMKSILLSDPCVISQNN